MASFFIIKEDIAGTNIEKKIKHCWVFHDFQRMKRGRRGWVMNPRLLTSLRTTETVVRWY
jgi:hypothetical protein